MEVFHHPILQGWLEKEKRSSSLLSSSTTKRWFTIEKAGTDFSDITLSYYKSPRANSVERCGWIFLSDCTFLEESVESHKVIPSSKNDSRRKSIGEEEEPRVIIIHHPSRKFRLRAQDRYQHRLWLDTLKEHCTNASGKEEQKEVSFFKFLSGSLTAMMVNFNLQSSVSLYLCLERCQLTLNCQQMQYLDRRTPLPSQIIGKTEACRCFSQGSFE